MSESKSRRIPKLIWLVLAAVLMVGLWIFLVVWLPYHREQIVKQDIERLGGVTYEALPEWIKVGPLWLQEWIQDIADQGGWTSHFNRIYSVDLSESKVTDEELKYLTVFKKLENLSLNETHVSAEGIKHISDLKKLKRLDFSETEITDKELMYFRGLTKLDSLHFNNTSVTEEGVKKLQKALPKCDIWYGYYH